MNEKLSTFDWIKHILLNLIFVISGNIIVYFYHYFDKLNNNNMFTIFYILEVIYGLIFVVLFFYHFGIFLNSNQDNFTFKRTLIEMIYVIGLIVTGLTIGITQIVINKSLGFLIIFSIYLLFYGVYLADLINHSKKLLNRYRSINLKGISL